MKTLKLGHELLDAGSVANAWVRGETLKVILKGVNNTAYLEMGSDKAANKALAELQKAMNGQEASDVEYDEQAEVVAPTPGEKYNKIKLVIWFLAGALTYTIFKVLS